MNTYGRKWMGTACLRFFACLVLIGIGAFALPGLARATGGTSIANAPTVPFGQQEFGNTTNVPQDNSGHYNEFWKLQLRAGDIVTINWEQDPSANITLYVFPAGTDDYSLGNTDPAESSNTSANSHGQLVFTANKSGVWPLDFLTGAYEPPGPYDFTAYVHHAVVLALASQTRALLQKARHAPLPHTGRLVVLVHDPDGGRIPNGTVGATLQGYWAKAWHKLRTAPVKGSQIVLAYRLPPKLHGLIRLSINIGGGDYVGKHILLRGIKV